MATFACDDLYVSPVVPDAASEALSTARLRLRVPVLADAGQIAALANDAAIAHQMADMPYPYRLSDAARTIERAAHGRQHRMSFVIALPDATVVGMIGLSRTAASAHELGVWIGKRFWGRGYATEAVQGLIGWAGRMRDVRLVTAGHTIDNPASAQMLINSDFLYTGVIEQDKSPVTGTLRAVRMMMRFV